MKSINEKLTVVQFPDVDKKAPRKDIVALLERTLEKAKAGEIFELAIAYVGPDSEDERYLEKTWAVRHGRRDRGAYDALYVAVHQLFAEISHDIMEQTEIVEGNN